MTFTTTVRNNFTNPVTGVVLTDILPTGATLVSSPVALATHIGGTLTFNPGNLAGEKTRTITVVVSPTVVGMATDLVTVPRRRDRPRPLEKHGDAEHHSQPGGDGRPESHPDRRTVSRDRRPGLDLHDHRHQQRLQRRNQRRVVEHPAGGATLVSASPAATSLATPVSSSVAPADLSVIPSVVPTTGTVGEDLT